MFEFPPDVKFPSLPVDGGDAGLIYPHQGISTCGAPEIATALWQGARIEIIRGVIVPWDDRPDRAELRPFVPKLREWQEQRALYPEGSHENLTYKYLGNCGYGKLAQGLRDKTSFDTRTNQPNNIGPSRITNAYFAMYNTSLVRAALSELIATCQDGIVAGDHGRGIRNKTT